MWIPVRFAGPVKIVADGTCLLKGKAACLECIEGVGGCVVKGWIVGTVDAGCILGSVGI
jgi:hypothetical protein